MLSGDDALTLPIMAVGGRGVISVVSNEIPREMVEMIEAAERNDFAAARAIHSRIMPLMQINFVESNPVPVKAAMAAMGLLEEVYRLPVDVAEARVEREDPGRAERSQAVRRPGATHEPRRQKSLSSSRPAPSADRDAARAMFARLREALSAGEVRAAEPDASSPVGWRVNTWVKQGILLGFRFGDNVDASMDHGRWSFVDKDTLPLKKFTVAAGVRIVPGGSSVRDGAYLAPGVICMPPMYVNIGAYIGEGSLIDSHALVGSCAQVGARVHVSAAAQIGGVIEPVGAIPVIVEDEVLVGGNTGLYEGVIVKARAVIAAGTVLTGSTPLYDLVKGEIIRPSADRPLVVPEGAVVVPGARAVTAGKGPEWSLSLATPVIVKYRDSRTDTRTELEAWIR